MYNINAEQLKSFGRKPLNILTSVAVVAVLITSVVSGNIKSGYEKDIKSQTDTINDLTNKISVQEATVANGKSEVAKLTTGIDVVRKQRDDDVVTELIKIATNWSSYAEYEQARTKISTDYVDAVSGKDNYFLGIFLGSVSTKTDKNGTVYNEIDSNKIVSNFSKLSTMVVSTDANKYSYFGVVTVNVTENGATKSTNFIISYSVDNEGNILSINAYT